ncbi:MAG: class I SAM-dependent methyltransferase [Firmicutes bacterium]|nr:class I SAM-dependent methyltransferase [Bacillota bacterium]
MYDRFAELYDEFMQEISAEEWADYAEALWTRHELSPHLVLDLCCGTGSLAIELTRRGYDLIGADGSDRMLDEAKKKLREASMEDKILLLLQDMREFELYGTVDSILCTCDSLNYLLQEEELETVFRLAENYLEQGGLFMFDMNTLYKYQNLLGDQTFAQVRDDAAFIWENYFYEEEGINEYTVTFFEKTADFGLDSSSRPGAECLTNSPQADNLYTRFQEIHYQKPYDIQRVKDLLEKAHLKVEGVYDAFTLDAPGPDSERISFVARCVRPKKTYEGDGQI